MALGQAFAFGRSSSLVRARAQGRPLFVSDLVQALSGQLFAEGSGRPIRDEQGEVIGAVGVTGEAEERDEALAAHGIRAAGLGTEEDCAGFAKRLRLQN